MIISYIAYALLALTVIALVTLFPSRVSNANSFSSSLLDPIFGSSGSFSLVKKVVLFAFLGMLAFNIFFIVVGLRTWTSL